MERRTSLEAIARSIRSGMDHRSTPVQAARFLLHRLLRESDPAVRARQARILAEGVGSRWSAADLEVSEIDAIAQALEDWDGELASQSFDEVCVDRLRRAADADEAAHGRKLVHSLLRLAGRLSWQDRHEAAMELAVEAVDIAREMHSQDPGYGDAALADVLERASRIHCQREDGADEAVRQQAEELALRRSQFDRTGDPEACTQLIAALHRQAADRNAADAKSLRNEALGAARRLVDAARSSGRKSIEAQTAFALALGGCLAPIITDGPAKFRLPSLHETASALPLIEELLTLDPEALAADCA